MIIKSFNNTLSKDNLQINEKLNSIIEEKLEKTLILAKSLDDWEGILNRFKISNKKIIAARSSSILKQKYPNIYVEEYITKKRTYSTSAFFRKDFFTKGIYEWFIKEEDLLLWLYRAYEWSKDLEQVKKIRVASINYDLYVKLTNKILIAKILKISTDAKYDFNTPSIFFEYANKLTLPFVVSAQVSDGGDGVFFIKNFEDFKKATSKISTPIIKLQKYLKGDSYNIMGVIFNDCIVAYQPSKQIIEIEDNNFKFKGSDFKIDLKEDIKNKMLNTFFKIANELKNLNYIGIFGCDFIVNNDEIYFIELNPRFQASSFILNYPEGLNPYIAHILAFSDCKLKKLINDCDNIYIEFENLRYHYFRYIKNYDEANKIIREKGRGEIRAVPQDFEIEDGAPWGFLIY